MNNLGGLRPSDSSDILFIVVDEQRVIGIVGPIPVV